jgi:hypothetical protein
VSAIRLSVILQCGHPPFERVQPLVDVGGGISAENAFTGDQSREVIEALAYVLKSLRDIPAQNLEIFTKAIEALVSIVSLFSNLGK